MYGYALRPILDSTRRDPYGQPERIGTKLEIDALQASIVREIYRRYADGASCRTIAKDLNIQGVPSAGSTWKRKVRRCSGWMGSAVRAILLNQLYTGRVRWNSGGYVRNPDTAKRVWRARPKDEWVEHCDEGVRIVSDELFQRAQQLNRARSNGDIRMKSGGRTAPRAARGAKDIANLFKNHVFTDAALSDRDARLVSTDDFVGLISKVIAAGHGRTAPRFHWHGLGARQISAHADTHGSGLILVVDDEGAIRIAMQSLLQSWGYSVITAGSYAEMLERIGERPETPSLIICDYRLRDNETGSMVIERLRNEYNDSIPGMLITGDTAPDRIKEAQASGYLLLHKPVSNAVLRAAIVRLMDGSSSQSVGPLPGAEAHTG